jgi:hypothetical protein
MHLPPKGDARVAACDTFATRRDHATRTPGERSPSNVVTMAFPLVSKGQRNRNDRALFAASGGGRMFVSQQLPLNDWFQSDRSLTQLCLGNWKSVQPGTRSFARRPKHAHSIDRDSRYPLDPTRSVKPAADPGDTSPPTILLTRPTTARPVGGQ